jgi:hypothetical protein
MILRNRISVPTSVPPRDHRRPSERFPGPLIVDTATGLDIMLQFGISKTCV